MAYNYMDPLTAYNEYYAVREETVKEGGIWQGTNFKRYANIDESIGDDFYLVFLDTVERLIQFERKKERQFLTQYYNKYKVISPDLAVQLQGLLFTDAPELSKAFSLIEMHRHKLKTQYDDLGLNFDKWQDYMSSFNNKFFVEACTKYIENLPNIGLMSPEEVTTGMIQYITESYNSNQTDIGRRNNFEFFMNTYSPALLQIVRDMKIFKDKNWTTSLNKIKFASSSSEKDIKSTYISKIITGIVNGLGQEEWLVAGGGVSTARATNKLLFFLPDKRGKKREMDLPTETDVYLTLKGDFTVNNQIEQLISRAKNNDEIRQIITKNATDDFVIHYSSKDLSIAESSKTSSVTAKLKGEGSIDSKINVLEELGRSMGQLSTVHELIFEAINSGVTLLYGQDSNVLDNVSRAITSLAFGFMFEDFNEQIEQIDNQSTNELHIYMISGQFFTISEILKVLVDQVKNWNSNSAKFINIGLKAASEDVYTRVKLVTKAGRKRWDEVRSEVMKQTTMKVIMNVTKLRDILNMALK